MRRAASKSNGIVTFQTSFSAKGTARLVGFDSFVEQGVEVQRLAGGSMLLEQRTITITYEKTSFHRSSDKWIGIGPSTPF